MELKVLFVLSLAMAAALAAPSDKMESDDMMAAEGHSVHSYAPAPAAPRYGGGATVTSYNRRGSYSQASDLAKPSIYGTRYSASSGIAAPTSYRAPASPVGISSSYRSAPVGYAPVQRYPAPELSSHHAAPVQSYGPQRNAFSEHSRHASADPHYDPAKDPVSQYAEYVPVFEYAPKARGSGNELSLYGYRK